MGQLGDLSPQGAVAIGVLVGLISTSLQAIGLTLQRKSHILEDEKHPYDLRRPPYKRKRWQIGFGVFILSNIVGSTIQITTLPLPVLSTLQASGLVFNTLFATLILAEPFTRYSLIGTILVCVGAVMIAIFGAIGEPAHTLDQLLVLLGRRPFLLWMAGTAVVVAITVLGAHALKLLLNPAKVKGWGSRHQLPLASALHSPRIKTSRGILYGSVSGILSAHCLLVAKSAVELVVRTIIDRVNQFNRWQSWAILVGLVALALTQLYYMHRGLKLCSTSVLYPLVFCIYNITAILDGLIYFHQESRLSRLHAGLIALGTVVLLSGVLCLSWRLDDVADHGGAAPIGPPRTPLAPGMGLLDEHANRTHSSDFFCSPDEESRPGERQPLLHTPHQMWTPSHRHPPSLPFLSLGNRRGTAPSIETVQIWADLYDEGEINPGDADFLSSLPPTPSPLQRYHRHHRSKSSTISFGSSSKWRPSFGSEGGVPSSPLSERGNIGSSFLKASTWSPRRLRLSVPIGTWRRSSNPIIAEAGAGPAQRDAGGALERDGASEGPDDRSLEPLDARSAGLMRLSRSPTGPIGTPDSRPPGERKKKLGWLRRWSGQDDHIP